MEPQPPNQDREPVHCSRCRHYWITHEPAHPHGCRVFAIKSERLPMVDVREASGRECELYERKQEVAR